MKKAVVYFILNLLFILLACFFGIGMFNDNSHLEGCDPDIWKLGKDFGSFFNWVWGKQPCRFTPGFTFGFYFYPFILYAGIKTYAAQNYHQALKLKFIALELLIYFSLYYGVLIYNMTSNGMELNFVLLFNAKGGNHRAGIVVCRRSLYCFGYGCTVKRYLFPGRFGTALSPAFSVFTDVGGFTPVVDTRFYQHRGQTLSAGQLFLPLYRPGGLRTTSVVTVIQSFCRYSQRLCLSVYTRIDCCFLQNI